MDNNRTCISLSFYLLLRAMDRNASLKPPHAPHPLIYSPTYDHTSSHCLPYNMYTYSAPQGVLRKWCFIYTSPHKPLACWPSFIIWPWRGVKRWWGCIIDDVDVLTVDVWICFYVTWPEEHDSCLFGGLDGLLILMKMCKYILKG